ncbi:beta-lactamase-like protein [Russula earlei]|uniref:Beta-lactamase-like protein n=1 Tax=Russula earlei TaxID=71964 RepID=A0ACC0UBJ4_9AGAM|nr:beta-lactamase-like protein [Russula earlei]
MPQWMSATFLGTSSGGGPTESRNCSSLVLDIVGDGSLWMIDCAEGTLRQFSLQPQKDTARSLKPSRVNKIFVTHMHPDHVMGLPTLLRNILGFPHPQVVSSRGTLPRIDLYGPAGLRTFLRTTLSLTRTKTADRYAVHELLTSEDIRTLCNNEVLHENEEPGRDVLCGEDGYWRNFAEGHSIRGSVYACAGPLVHRDPCIGFIIHEPASLPAPRKLAILGDTSSAAKLTPLLSSTPGRLSLLVHEATAAHVPKDVDSRLAARSSPSLVASKAQARGHSTPIDAGVCAGKWGARQLVLNHIGSKFPAPSPGSCTGRRVAVIREIERQATEAWQSTPCDFSEEASASVEGRKAKAAYDFLTVQVPLQPNDPVKFDNQRVVTSLKRRWSAHSDGIH